MRKHSTIQAMNRTEEPVANPITDVSAEETIITNAAQTEDESDVSLNLNLANLDRNSQQVHKQISNISLIGTNQNNTPH